MAYFWSQGFPAYRACPRRSQWDQPPCYSGQGSFDPSDFITDMLAGMFAHAQQRSPGEEGCRGRRRQGACKSNPTKWQKIVKLPSGFGPNDLTVKADGHKLTIKASRLEGDEKTGTDRHEALRHVEVPKNVDMESVKTLWLRGGQGVMVVGMRKQDDEIQKPNDKAQDEQQEKPTSSCRNFSHPFLPFQLDPEICKEQMKAIFEDISEVIPGCGGPTGNAQKEGKGACQSEQTGPHSFFPFNVDPEHFREQMKAVMEELHETFGAGADSKKNKEPEQAATTEAEPHQPTVTSDQEPQQPTATTDPEPQEEVVSDSDWVKPESTDYHPVTEAEPIASENVPVEGIADAMEEDLEVKEDDPTVNIMDYVVEKSPSSPIVEEPAEPHTIRVDVSGYRPDEVNVEVNGDKVKVSASHVEENDGEFEEYSFRRSFNLPDGADSEHLSWRIDDEGVLTVSIPWLQEHIVKEDL